MKYFFEAGMGKRQSKPGVRPRANFSIIILREQWEYTNLFIKISIVKTEVRGQTPGKLIDTQKTY